MSKMKKTLSIVIILIVGCLVGAGFMYYFGPSKNNSVEQIENSEKRNLDENIPEDTLSPHVVSTQFQKYVNKQIKVRGLVTATGDDKYIIVSQDPNESIALPLDFSQTSIDPKTYANPSYANENQSMPGDTKLKDPVTITGKLNEIKNNGSTSITFVVESIE